MFHTLEGLNHQEMIAANVRTFEGDGTPYLFCPGLLEVSSVRCGSTSIPLSHIVELPLDVDGKRIASIPVPLVDLQFTESGDAVLLRSNLSNHGEWQPGVFVHVGGVWDEGVPAPEPPAPVRRPGRPPLKH